MTKTLLAATAALALLAAAPVHAGLSIAPVEDAVPAPAWPVHWTAEAQTFCTAATLWTCLPAPDPTTCAVARPAAPPDAPVVCIED